MTDCPTFVGSVFPASYLGTQHRSNFGIDPRGTSFWLAGSPTGAGPDFVEEYSFPGLALLQRFDLPSPGMADFWGGDGAGNVVYLQGNDIVKCTPGGTVTVLFSTATFGGIDVGQDPTNNRLVHVQRNTGSPPYNSSVIAIDFAGTATTLATFSTGSQPTNGSYVGATPDGAVWFTVGFFPRFLFRWSPVDGYTVSTIAMSSFPVPRPDSSVYADNGTTVEDVAGPTFTTSSLSCPDLSPVSNADGPIALVAGSVILAQQVPQSSASVQWDIWQLAKLGGWGVGVRIGGQGWVVG